MAVKITNGVKTFRKRQYFVKNSNDVRVLQNFNLNIPTGSLYSLLGSSGCGKTTVISIIMGLCKLDTGILKVSRSSRALGYMPQETCLYSEFSILETLQYFAVLFGRWDDHINRKESYKSRIDYLKKLLLLPSLEQIVGTLSGGQKRRLSLAVALVHEPEILLLDEPTAGLDPLVRELVWEHLSTLARTKGTTIIVTTHYVDEAKGSDFVGFMRNGQLIAEDSPTNLFHAYNENSMEKIFLALCQQETNQHIILPSSSCFSNAEISRSLQQPSFTARRRAYIEGTARRIYALVGKNYKCTFRNMWMLLLITTIPAVWMIVTCISFQDDHHYIPLGVVNDDVNINGDGCIKNDTIENVCREEQLSCVFLESLTGSSIHLINIETVELATKAVKEGNVWGYIYFSKNYTSALTNTVFMGSSSYFDKDEAGKREWNNSKITLRMDQTSTVIFAKVITTLFSALENSSKIMLENCGYDKRIAESPLKYMDPIVGEKRMTYLNYVAPSLAIEYGENKFIYFFSLVTAIRFISEKRDGTLERCKAGGARNWEILISYAITQSSVLLFQVVLVILVLFGYSIITHLSNVPLVLVLCYLQGLSGLAVGLLLAIFCGEESQAAIAIIALVLPNALISGLIWPLEGLPEILQNISPYLPMTMSGEAIRSLMVRGWNINHPNVWQGFSVTIFHLILFSFLNLVLIGRQLRK